MVKAAPFHLSAAPCRAIVSIYQILPCGVEDAWSVACVIGAIFRNDIGHAGILVVAATGPVAVVEGNGPLAQLVDVLTLCPADGHLACGIPHACTVGLYVEQALHLIIH